MMDHSSGSCTNMESSNVWDELAHEVRFELRQIRALLDKYGVILDAAAGGADDDTTAIALGGVLHAFYNGVENILLRVAKRVDNARSEGSSWHRELLDAMVRTTPARRAVISEGLRDKLDEYLRFRHRFRYSYSFDLHMEMMAPLARSCPHVFEALHDEVESFLQGEGGQSA